MNRYFRAQGLRFCDSEVQISYDSFALITWEAVRPVARNRTGTGEQGIVLTKPVSTASADKAWSVFWQAFDLFKHPL